MRSQRSGKRQMIPSDFFELGQFLKGRLDIGIVLIDESYVRAFHATPGQLPEDRSMRQTKWH